MCIRSSAKSKSDLVVLIDCARMHNFDIKSWYRISSLDINSTLCFSRKCYDQGEETKSSLHLHQQKLFQSTSKKAFTFLKIVVYQNRYSMYYTKHGGLVNIHVNIMENFGNRGRKKKVKKSNCHGKNKKKTDLSISVIILKFQLHVVSPKALSLIASLKFNY